MARPRSPGASACVSLLLLLVFPAATATSYSALCSFPAEAAELGAGDQLDLPLPSDGYFSGGAELLFASDSRRLPRSFSFFPRHVARTTNPSIFHLVATVTLSGYRRRSEWRGNFSSQYSVSFDLKGYYSIASDSAAYVLCMVGSGSRAIDDGSGVVILPDVVLRLRLPHPASLMQPFVTGRIDGPNFGPVDLVAYAEGDYRYGEATSCPPPPGHVRAARQVLHADHADFPCHRLRALLRGSYTMEYVPGRASSTFPLSQRHRSMHINKMYCAKDAAVRAYMVFDAETPSDVALPPIPRAQWRRRFEAAGDEALVAEGFWDSSRSQLCLKACRAVNSAVRESECGIGMNFWFPAVWSIRDRSVVAGLIWNTSRKSDDDTDRISGVISVSKTEDLMSNLSAIFYSYTKVEDAMNHYYSKPELNKERNGRFPGNYSYRDFAFDFFMTTHRGYGYASPVTLGSAMVDGGRLMADYAFYRHAVPEMNKQRLLNVSYDYDINLFRPVNNSSRGANASLTHDRWRISAEGVYDSKTGTLCMVGCRVTNGSSDCEILVTFQFAPADGGDDGKRANGEISSLRKMADPHFFETLDIFADGVIYMSAMQADEAISRMDMERIMLMSSMTLSCVFLLLQLRHAKKNPDALPATSVTMLAVLALGYMIPLVLNFDAMFVDDGAISSSKHYVQLASGGRLLELNELALRASTMVAFVLQMRLLHLAWSARSSTGVGEQWAAEGSTLWICLPLYLAGAVLIWVGHIGDGRIHTSQVKLAIEDVPLPQPQPPLLSDHLVSYAGLILDGFLLPQVVSNAFSRSRVKAISPWFYVGGTAIRAAPHAYDVLRARGYVQRWMPSSYVVYAGPRDDLFSVAWDVVIPCGAAALAVLLYFQQRLGGDFLCCVKGRRSGGYEMVSTPTLISS